MKREEIKKEKVIDNMDYKTEKDEMQKDNGMLVADVSNKMNTKQINAYIKAYKSGAPVKDKVFIAAGDKKEPATVQEINNYLKEIKEAKKWLLEKKKKKKLE